MEGVAAGVDIITVSAFERDGCQSITPYQGRKIGTAIISETVDYLKINGKTAIRLAIDKGNPQSSHFWKKNHFKVISEADVNGWPKLVAERKLRK